MTTAKSMSAKVNLSRIGIWSWPTKPFYGSISWTVTNVGSSNSTYIAKISAPLGLKISVNPSVLSFSYVGEKKSFALIITGSMEKSSLASASLVWDGGGAFQVRSPIIVYVVV
ncbi:hypothetical protein M0R45_037452 [Rubus argutus]|uniref:Subtilisin-like protease fibronectin type-III domain-containing protein n=1 Tax=Rubus argutus TaxID=59490 RepID=A0AAW1W3I9_RUBAR